jgi:hypothetical protein
MINISNISSEEELLELRNDGKITEAEYNDLLAAMRTSSLNNLEEVAPGANDAKTKRKQGKIAFVMMLVAIILPIVALALEEGIPTDEQVEISPTLVESQDRTIAAEETTELQKEAEQTVERFDGETRDNRANTDTTIGIFVLGSFLLLDLALGLAALVLGIISWPNAYGKATVITIVILGFLTLIIAALGP